MKKVAYGFLGIGVAMIVLSFTLTFLSNTKYNNLIDSFSENESSLTSLKILNDNVDKERNKLTDDMLGIIKIPEIDLEFPILEGVEDKVLKNAVGHFPSTVLPGNVGNCTLIGHNDFVLAEPFKKLNKLSLGDTVIITTKTGDYTYEITKSYTVNPYNRDVVKNSKNTKLTLITCTDDAQKRLVLEAILTLDNNNIVNTEKDVLDRE